LEKLEARSFNILVPCMQSVHSIQLLLKKDSRKIYRKDLSDDIQMTNSSSHGLPEAECHYTKNTLIKHAQAVEAGFGGI